MNKNNQQLLFDKFFKELNRNSMTYAIVGMTDNLPATINGDVDIVIQKDKLVAFYSFIQSLDIKDISLVQIIQHEANAHYFVIFDEINHSLLKVDVCTDYYRNGQLFLKANWLLENRKFNSKGFFQLSKEKEFTYYLLKKIDKGKIHHKEFFHLKSQWLGTNPEILTQFFSKCSLDIIYKSFSTSNFDVIIENLHRLKYDLKGRLFYDKTNLLQNIKRYILRGIQPTGLIVAFLGPDGCGKTTVIKGVSDNLKDVFRGYKLFHFSPRESGYSSDINTTPHSSSPRGKIISFFKLIYYTILFNMGYIIKLYPFKVKSSLIIFDRYFHDLFADPRRYRYSSNKLGVKLVSYLIPEPDLWVILNADSKIIQKRKSEVTPNETDRQLKVYRKLSCELDNAFTVNANKSKNEVVIEVEKIILDFMRDRITNRYPRS